MTARACVTASGEGVNMVLIAASCSEWRAALSEKFTWTFDAMTVRLPEVHSQLKELNLIESCCATVDVRKFARRLLSRQVTIRFTNCEAHTRSGALSGQTMVES